MILYAPGLAPVASILLPDPVLANSRGQVISTNLRTSRDGTQYTYNRKNTDKVLNYDFEGVGRGKLVELQEFLKTYQGTQFRIQDHRNVMWLAYLTPESFNTVMSARAFPILETGTVSLSFVGAQYA